MGTVDIGGFDGEYGIESMVGTEVVPDVEGVPSVGEEDVALCIVWFGGCGTSIACTTRSRNGAQKYKACMTEFA